MNDPVERFYTLGYQDASQGKRRRVPHMYRLAYTSGRYDAVTGKQSRYSEKVKP